MSKLSGGDQTLLTTLQGVVNRTKPELYFLFNPGGPDGPDAKWLADMRLPATRYDDPLDLVAKFRSRIRGAIVHDPAVPDSLNVATAAAARERREDVAHCIMTFVQDGSRAYHQPCAAAVALSRKAMFCNVWSGESLPPDLCCAACGRTIAQPLPAFSDKAEHASGT